MSSAKQKLQQVGATKTVSGLLLVQRLPVFMRNSAEFPYQHCQDETGQDEEKDTVGRTARDYLALATGQSLRASL